MTEGTLVQKLDNIVDGYYRRSEDYKDVVKALERYESIWEAVRNDSLASDGMEMIQAVQREMREQNDCD